MAAHVIPPRTYYTVFGVLMLLLVLTIVAAQFHFGPLNLVIAMGIAGAKALLIGLYFMHLRYALPLVRVFALTGIVWLAIGGLLTMADYLTRGWHELPGFEAPIPYQPAEVDIAVPPRHDSEPEVTREPSGR